MDCIFCKIIAGEIPCFKLYESDDTLAFMDINPANEGHALVIPKEHFADVQAISNAAISSTVITAKMIAAAIEKTLSPDGINLLQCNGPAAARDPAAVLADVLDGKVTTAAARDDYGVAVDPVQGTIDQSATDRLRADRD